LNFKQFWVKKEEKAKIGHINAEITYAARIPAKW
jgi:hypothetical protein